MFAGVCERAPKPSMQVRPSHHADDMGARFGEPSGLSELTRTTGVPKYRMAGSMTLCIGRAGLGTSLASVPTSLHGPRSEATRFLRGALGDAEVDPIV